MKCKEAGAPWISRSTIERQREIQQRRLVMRALNTQRAIQRFVSITLAFMSAGCAQVTLAPGADQVKVTRVPVDVAACVAVGNVDGRRAPASPVTAFGNCRIKRLVLVATP